MRALPRWVRADAQGDNDRLRKHGVSFEEAASVFLDPAALTFSDPDHSEDEERAITIGRSARRRVLFVAHTDAEIASESEISSSMGETGLPARRLGVLEEPLAEILIGEKLPQRPLHRLLSHRRPPRVRVCRRNLPMARLRARALTIEESPDFQALRRQRRPASLLIAPRFACSIPRKAAWNPTASTQKPGPTFCGSRPTWDTTDGTAARGARTQSGRTRREKRNPSEKMN